MPWFKVDDKHHDHKKTRKALRGVAGKRRDAGAMGLWELAGSWSADNLMDGFVPTDELFRWDDDWEALAQRLVAAGYWEPTERDGEVGFQFINWDEHQPMKADVEAKREAAKERMRSLRSGSRARSAEVRANTTRSDASSSPTPSRPVPSRPDPSTTSASSELDRDFDEWWSLYPRKKGKGQALKAYRAARKKTTATELVNALRDQSGALMAKGADFCPYAATWLNGERWADEPDSNVRQLRTDDQGRTLLPPLPSRSPWGQA